MDKQNRTEWRKGNPDHFTGDTWIGSLSESADPNGVRVLAVQFNPAARTNWHSHAEGQVLHILAGDGVVVNEAGERVDLAPGDTVTTPPNQLHWHGALPETPMLQMSITTGGGAIWSDRVVTDEEYRAGAER